MIDNFSNPEYRIDPSGDEWEWAHEESVRSQIAARLATSFVKGVPDQLDPSKAHYIAKSITGPLRLGKLDEDNFVSILSMRGGPQKLLDLFANHTETSAVDLPEKLSNLSAEAALREATLQSIDVLQRASAKQEKKEKKPRQSAWPKDALDVIAAMVRQGRNRREIQRHLEENADGLGISGRPLNKNIIIGLMDRAKNNRERIRPRK